MGLKPTTFDHNKYHYFKCIYNGKKSQGKKSVQLQLQQEEIRDL